MVANRKEFADISNVSIDINDNNDEKILIENK